MGSGRPEPSADSVWQRQHKHAGRWILFDDRAGLLTVGEHRYAGQSARSTLDQAARAMLPPLVKHAVADGLARTTTVTWMDQRWQVRARPVLGPLSREVLAVHCCYTCEGSSFPSEPLVGSWEWDITPPGERQRMRVYFSRELYELCGMLPRTRDDGQLADGGWDATDWLRELLEPGDRAEIRRTIDKLVTSSNQDLRTQDLRVTSPDTGRTHWLRVASRRSATSADGGFRWRGVATVKPPDGDQAPRQRAAEPILDAVFRSSDALMIVVAADYEHIWLATDRFDTAGLAIPPEKNLLRMCHPADRGVLREVIAQCGDGTRRTGRVRLASHIGGWLGATVTGVAVPFRDGPAVKHVLCHVTVDEPDGGSSAWP